MLGEVIGEKPIIESNAYRYFGRGCMRLPQMVTICLRYTFEILVREAFGRYRAPAVSAKFDRLQ